MGLAATALIAAWLILTMLNAGPLWRDETNSLNVARMPSLAEAWHRESFPALWLLLLRLWDGAGFAESDLGIRALGLLVGFTFLGSLWLCIRWLRGRAPTLTLALIGTLPAFINIVGANRAYGLALALLVLSFGALWRVVEAPSRSRVVVAGMIGALFLQCVYYDAIFYCAMLIGGALVAVRRRQWKTLAALVGIGGVAGSTLLIYLPVFRSSSPYLAMLKGVFGPSLLWAKINGAVAARSSAQAPGAPGPEIWTWVVLIAIGAIVAAAAQARRPDKPAECSGPDLALFSGVTMLGGTAGYLCFLLRLQFLTEPWYYIGMLALCAISLDGILSTPWPALRPWGFIRVVFLVLMVAWNRGATWEEARTRRTNVDLVAAALERSATERDLIIVRGAWEGISFDRYYQGKARWVTVPPLDSHEIHRTDLVWEKLNQPEPMAPVLDEITRALRSGGRVWVVGRAKVMTRGDAQLPRPEPATGRYLGPYMDYWSAQVMAHLAREALPPDRIPVPVDGPVNYQEDLPLLRFSGRPPGAR